MGLSRTGIPESSLPSATASSSPTFTPAIITYSSVTRPRAAACSRTASTSSSSGWPRSTGMSVARFSGMAELSDTQSRNLCPSAV